MWLTGKFLLNFPVNSVSLLFCAHHTGLKNVTQVTIILICIVFMFAIR